MSYTQALEEQLSLTRYLHTDTFARDLVEVTGCEESASKAKGALHIALQDAAPYYWAATIVSVIGSVWKEMPDWTLTQEHLPTRAGFFWFVEPLSVPCPSGSDCNDPLRALLWTTERNFVTNDETGLGDELDVVWLYSFLDGPERRCGTPGNVVPWPLLWTRQSVATQEGVRVNGLPDFKDAMLRIFAACLAFVEQRIFVASERQIERHARRRLERDKIPHDPVVRVIELRRKHARSENRSESEPVEWSHQWIVSGHWRQQWYPSLSRHQPRWVMPYIKGPEDRPLKPPTTKVFAVVR